MSNLGVMMIGSLGWVLPPLSNSWILLIIWLYIALNRTPNIDCYWGGRYPIIRLLGFRGLGVRGGAQIRITLPIRVVQMVEKSLSSGLEGFGIRA